MRIRKHARVSAPSLSPPPPPSSTIDAPPSTVICELNRSPWDVIAFHDYQIMINDDHVEREESDCAHHSSFDCLKAQFWEDVAKKAKHEEIEDKQEEEDDDDDMRLLVHVKENARRKKKAKVKREMDYIRCSKTDGKGWHCRNEAKDGYPLCEHHQTQLKSYNYNQGNCPRKVSQVKRDKQAALKTTARSNVVVNKRRKGRITSASPTEFYYYSGFGPSWRRRRGGGDGNEIKKEELQVLEAYANDHEASSSSLAQDHAPDEHGHEDGDHQEEDRFIGDDFTDDSDDDDDDGKKRIRKPIKARSLKSLL